MGSAHWALEKHQRKKGKPKTEGGEECVLGVLGLGNGEGVRYLGGREGEVGFSYSGYRRREK